MSREQTIATIRELIVCCWPHRFDPGDVRDDLSLGSEGLGLDSIEIVEVITACEELLGRESSAELFATAPLTLSSMADFFRC